MSNAAVSDATFAALKLAAAGTSPNSAERFAVEEAISARRIAAHNARISRREAVCAARNGAASFERSYASHLANMAHSG